MRVFIGLWPAGPASQTDLLFTSDAATQRCRLLLGHAVYRCRSFINIYWSFATCECFL